MEHFLQRTGNNIQNDVIKNKYQPNPKDMTATIDGVSFINFSAYRATSSLFRFTADPALATTFDSCITGNSQYGVSVGYWFLLPPLAPGEHTLIFGGGPSWKSNITYVLTVK
jgi:hypothetical protein